MIVSIVLGLLLVSLLIVLGLILSKNVFNISSSARLWEFWCLYGFTIIVFISEYVCYKSYIELRNNKGKQGKQGKQGKKGDTGLEGKCIWR